MKKGKDNTGSIVSEITVENCVVDGSCKNGEIIATENGKFRLNEKELLKVYKKQFKANQRKE